MDKSNKKMKFPLFRNNSIILVMIVLLAFQYAISDTVASTYTIEAYDYEKIVFLTGDQTFNVKILLYPLLEYNPITIHVFDSKNYRNWKNGRVYSSIFWTNDTEQRYSFRANEYYLQVEENMKYYLILDNLDSSNDTNFNMNLSARYGFYSGEVHIRDIPSNLFYALFSILLIPITLIVVRV
ncbi:MAG: hypothetical protein ACXAAM_06665, partial [Candidatus Heimdallarchaeaceae archaeon]